MVQVINSNHHLWIQITPILTQILSEINSNNLQVQGQMLQTNQVDQRLIIHRTDCTHQVEESVEIAIKDYMGLVWIMDRLQTE